MVEFNHVSKVYDKEVFAVDDVSFKLEEGDFVFLIGPSGSGKTTIIKMLIRDEVPSSGRIFFNDSDITRVSRNKVYKLRREIGVIFQDFKLVQDKTAFENVAFAMEAAGKTDREIKDTVPYVLDIVGLSNRLNAFPKQLSGGEQQRVAIARAIANNPKILIADEPTGNLDPASSWDIVQVLTKINNWGTTVIMSTHGTDIVNSLNKRVIQMEGGKIIRDDNKGQYEMTGVFEDKIIEKTEKEPVEEEVKAESTKNKKFQIRIPKEESKEHLQSIQDVKKQSFFSKFINKITDKNKIKKTDQGIVKNPEINIEEVLQNVQKIPNKEKESVIMQEVAEEDKQKMDAMNKENNKEEEQKAKAEEMPEEEISEEQKNESKEALTTSFALAGEIDGHRPQDGHGPQDKKESRKKTGNIKLNATFEKEEEKPVNDILSIAEETSVDSLNVTKKIIKDLKKSGYLNLKQIISDGPDKMASKLTLQPDEIVKISKEIKKFVEANE